MKNNERIKLLEMAIQQLGQQLQETRTVMEKLAVISDLEWSNDLHDWVKKDNLDALRKAPR